MEPDIEIVAPDGTTIKFPAGTPDDEILRVMQENFGGPEDAAYYAEPGMSENNPIDLTTIDRSTPEGQALVSSLTRGTWVKGADGTVYALPDDAREGSVTVGDEPLSPGLVQRPFSGVEDVAKSFPTGVVEGVTGLLGTPGALGDFGAGGSVASNVLLSMMPTGAEMNQGIRDQLGRDYYQAQTPAGEFSQTAGEFLPGAVAPGGAGTRLASWLVPAFASEGAGQIARGMSGGRRDTDAENYARLLGGLGGGLGVGAFGAVRGGADIALRGAAEGVTPQQLELASQLRQRGGSLGVDLTNAEALQQVTSGGTGLGRLQRVVEGQTSRMAPMFGRRPEQVEQAIAGELNRLGPMVEPGPLAGQARSAANRVLENTRADINAQARPFYRAADEQVVSAEEYAALQEIPTYREAEAAFFNNPEMTPGVGGPQSVSAINRVIQEMDTLARQADQGNMTAGANANLARVRGESAELAKGLVDLSSPSYAQARAIGAAGRQNELVPLQRGPIGSIAAQPELQPSLPSTTERLFPSQPFEGQAAETARALELMGQADPTVGGPLVRQHLARQAMEAQQALATGDNQFGGANFAARAFGNPEQRRTVMGAIDVTAPPPSPLAFPPLNPNAPQAMPSDPMAQLVEVLQATGQRARAGSETAFNQEAIRNLQGGNLATNAAQTLTNPTGVFGRAGRWIDDLTARRNAETLADLLMANSDEFNARLTRAINRPRGANRVRAAATLGAVQED